MHINTLIGLPNKRLRKIPKLKLLYMRMDISDQLKELERAERKKRSKSRRLINTLKWQLSEARWQIQKGLWKI